MEILDDIRTEHDRVAFLKSAAEQVNDAAHRHKPLRAHASPGAQPHATRRRPSPQLLVKARIKLNLKNLYSSNGFAVRELLKVWCHDCPLAVSCRVVACGSPSAL